MHDGHPKEGMKRATIDEIRDEFAKGAITEADLRERGWHLDGFYNGSGHVFVNPRPSIVETLLHELIHRRWPSWREKRVDSEAKRLLSEMNHAEVAQWYQAYQKAARKRKTPRKIEDE